MRFREAGDEKDRTTERSRRAQDRESAWLTSEVSPFMPSIFHDKAIELAVLANTIAIEKNEGVTNDILDDAFFALSHDCICVHRAIGALTDAGWPSLAAVLLRTLLDMNASGIALAESANPRLAAFKYLYSGFRRLNRLQGFAADVRQHNRQQVRERIAALPPELRPEAIAAFKDRDRPYWFCPEWQSPVAIMKRYAAPGTAEFYQGLSSVVHGGFLGMRLYRERPDSKSVEPESPEVRSLDVGLQSCRLLLEVVRIRNAVQELGITSAIQWLIDQLRAAALARPRKI